LVVPCDHLLLLKSALAALLEPSVSYQTILLDDVHAWSAIVATASSDGLDASEPLLRSLLQGLQDYKRQGCAILATAESLHALPSWFLDHFAIVEQVAMPGAAASAVAVLTATYACPTLVQLAGQRVMGLSCRNLARLAGYLTLEQQAHPEHPAATIVTAAFELLHTTRRSAFPVHVGTTPWTAFAGYPDLKARLARVIDSLGDPACRRFNLRPTSGLLLHGPSGCGKTLLAHALVTRSHLCCLSVRVTDILSRYLGETEANIRQLFRTARELQPCVVLLDNVECLIARRRADNVSSTGVEERALSQLLNEMDGIEPAHNVFYIGTTSAPLNTIDAAALRPGLGLPIWLWVCCLCVCVCACVCVPLNLVMHRSVRAGVPCATPRHRRPPSCCRATRGHDVGCVQAPSL
jgi:hypothetical protein